MTRARIAGLTIVTLTLLALCCQVLPSAHLHDGMQVPIQSATHVVLLAMSLPLAVTSTGVLVAVSMLLLLFASSVAPRTAPFLPHTRSSRPPDFLQLSPLRLAFADGILNPKAY